MWPQAGSLLRWLRTAAEKVDGTAWAAAVGVAVEEEAPPAEEESAPLPQPDLARSDSATWDIFGALPTPNQSSGDLAAQGRGATPPPPPQEISQEDILAGLSSASPAPPVAPAAAVSFDPFG